MSAYHMIIDGQKVAAAETFPVLNPATEEVIAECPRASEADLDSAVAAARRAFPGWSATPDEERSRIIHAIADALEAELQEIEAEYEKAAADYTRALELLPTFTLARQNRVEAYLRLGRLTDVESDVELIRRELGEETTNAWYERLRHAIPTE